MRLAGVPLPETSRDHQREPAAGQRDEVVVVAAHLVAGAADARPARSRRRAAAAREQALLDLRAICRSRSCRSFSIAHAMQARRLERRLRLPGERGGEVDLLLAVGAARGALADGEQAARRGRPPRAGRPARNARATSSVPRAGLPGGRRRGAGPPSARSSRRRSAGSTRGSSSRRTPRAPATAQGAVRPQADTPRSARRGSAPSRSWPPAARSPSSSSVAVSSRPMSNRLFSWKTLTDSDWLTPPQLLVDEPVLDRRGRAGGQALQEAPLLAAEGPLPRAAGRGRAGRSCGRPRRTGHTRASPACAKPGSPGAGVERGRRRPRGRPASAGAPGRQPARGAQPEHAGRFAVRHVEGAPRHLQLAHHDQQRRVQDLAAAEGGAERRREVEQRDQLGHALQQRGLAPLAPELVERLLVLVDDRRAHGRCPGAASGLRLTMQQTLRCDARRNVTESMIRPIRCTPRPPVRRSLA